MASTLPGRRTRTSTALAETGRLPYETLLEEAERMAARLRGSRTGNFPGDTGVNGKGKTPPKSGAAPRKGSRRQQVGQQKPGDASAGVTRNASKRATPPQGATQKPQLRNSASRNGLPNAVDSRNAKLAGAKRRRNPSQGVARG